MQIVEHRAARLALRWGDLDAAARWAAASGRSADDAPLLFQHEDTYLSLARVWIAQGRSVEALRLLDRLLPIAEADARAGSAIEILMLRALALKTQRVEKEACLALEQALTLAEPEGYIRTFLDEGEPMRLLMADFRSRIEEYASHLTAYVDKLLTVFVPVQPAQYDDPLSNQHSAINNLIEPPSERELEVLRLIDEGLSNREIAERLIVGLGTIKTHINNLYRKLDVNTRTQALARARELGLL